MSQTATPRVALITGAGRPQGIGAAIARRLARDGIHVAIADLCEPPGERLHPGTGRWESLQALAQELRAAGVESLPIRVDVTDAASVQAMVQAVQETFGRLDILVNNAGAVFAPAPVAEMADDAWRNTLAVNATGTFLCSKYALPLIIGSEGGGRIVNMASLAAERPRPYMSAYAAGKAAVVALTQSLAQEVAAYGITVNAVLPGDIDTPMKQWGFQLESQILQRPYEEVVRGLVARIPVGRLGTPEDVAALVAFLVSDDAAFITGQAYKVTGGRELT